MAGVQVHVGILKSDGGEEGAKWDRSRRKALTLAKGNAEGNLREHHRERTRKMMGK